MSVRRRLTATLFGGAALGATGYIAAVTVTPLAVEEITGNATLAGLPGAVAILGAAVGTSLLTLRVSERGRRPGLTLGYAFGALGAVTSSLAVIEGSLGLLLVGMAVMGLGHASSQLARYAGAEMYPAQRRASALSLIVWAGTVGSVLGPSLLQAGGRLATGRGYPELTGGYLLAVVFMAAAMLLYFVGLRPDPTTLSTETWTTTTKPALSGAFRLPHVRVALTALITGQVVMVMIMTATPLHIRHGGSDLGIVGLVMSAHTLGMFAFSPLTGRLADRIGRQQTVLAGLAVLGVSAVLAAVTPIHSTPLLLAALFLLGLGWNLAFVAGSALLTIGFSPELRARLQGRVDSITWLSSAAASILSGVFYQVTDYRALSLIGLGLLAVPTVIVIRNRIDLAPSTVT
ncbi:MAG TPA: MFS transporter [Acidimicrobiia bacterium]|nr:MFS transporter [Acidimicrobiia bacterium]